MNKNDALALWNRYNETVLTPSLIEDIQAEWESAVIALHKTLLGKTKKNWNKAFTALKKNHEDELKAVMIPFQDRVSARYKEFNESKEAMKAELGSFAKTYIPEVSTDIYLLKSKSGGDYHTQGFGANKYAKSALEEDFKLLELLGYNPEIKDAGGHNSGGMYSQYYATYELWAKITPFDFVMLEMSGKFISILNWAVMCWRKNTNPKVYFPFLSQDDYEKSQVLAYNTDYEVTVENMSIELSWQEINDIKHP